MTRELKLTRLIQTYARRSSLIIRMIQAIRRGDSFIDIDIPVRVTDEDLHDLHDDLTWAEAEIGRLYMRDPKDPRIAMSYRLKLD